MLHLSIAFMLVYEDFLKYMCINLELWLRTTILHVMRQDVQARLVVAEMHKWFRMGLFSLNIPI